MNTTTWTDRIKHAQRCPTVIIDGQIFERVRRGDEKPSSGRNPRFADVPCDECGVIKGEFHVSPCCDLEECPKCHGQAISCGCKIDREADETTH